MDTHIYVFNLQNSKDIGDNINQLSRLLRKLNSEKSIFKYKFNLSIYSDNVTFNEGKGPITPSTEYNFFNIHGLPPFKIIGRHRKYDEPSFYIKGIKIYFNEIKFYKRFINFQSPYLKIIEELRDMFILLKAKGVISIVVTVQLSYR